MTLRLEMLGALRCERDGSPLTGFVSAKVQALLCFLVVTAREQRRDTLAGLLWGEKTDADAKLSLRVALSNLRQLMGDHLAASRESVSFRPNSGDLVDVTQFELGARVQPTDWAADQVAALQRVDALYRGDFLEGFFVRDAPAFEEWMVAERTRLRNLELRALYHLAMYHARQKAFAKAIEYTQRSLQLEPWQEECYYRLMQWYADSGQRGAALAQYEACRRMLAAEFNAAPSEATTALYQHIRAS